MLETDLTSDILIYNLLKTTNDDFINQFNIKFINQSVPAEENNTIYIANMDLETRAETFNSAEYTAMVDILVKTKNTDYLEGSQFLRTAVKHIKNVLKNNLTCKQRHIVFRNISYEYGSTYTLKGLHIIVQMNEHESNSPDRDIITQIELDGLETHVVAEDLYLKEKSKKH